MAGSVRKALTGCTFSRDADVKAILSRAGQVRARMRTQSCVRETHGKGLDMFYFRWIARHLTTAHVPSPVDAVSRRHRVRSTIEISGII